MRKIILDQGTDEWKEWRKNLITSTDAPVLLGISPYATPYQGWLRKTGKAEEPQTNFAMLQGQINEPIARNKFIAEYNIPMSPCVVESECYNFIGTSLDGISDCGRWILEIKNNGYQVHNDVKLRGLALIPSYHMAQIQHHLLATDHTAEMCYYLSYNNGEMVVVEIFPDMSWLKNYIVKAKEYWKCLMLDEPPSLTEKDYTNMENSLEWSIFAEEYKELSLKIKELEAKKEHYKNQLVELCDEKSCKGHGIKIMRKTIKGRVDYDAIPQLKELDLNIFRKPSSVSWTVTIDK